MNIEPITTYLECVRESVKEWLVDLKLAQQSPVPTETSERCGGDDEQDAEWGDRLRKYLYGYDAKARTALAMMLSRSAADDFQAKLEQFLGAADAYSNEVLQVYRREYDIAWTKIEELGERYVEAGHATDPRRLMLDRKEAIDSGDFTAGMGILGLPGWTPESRRDFWGCVNNAEDGLRCELLHARYKHGEAPAVDFIAYLADLTAVLKDLPQATDAHAAEALAAHRVAAETIGKVEAANHKVTAATLPAAPKPEGPANPYSPMTGIQIRQRFQQLTGDEVKPTRLTGWRKKAGVANLTARRSVTGDDVAKILLAGANCSRMRYKAVIDDLVTRGYPSDFDADL